MNFRRHAQELPAFQFTAMIDVVFLLLCFFITTSVFSQWELEVDVVLPTAQSSKMPDRLPGEVIVNLSREGEVTINRQRLSRADLQDRLSRLARFFPGQSVVIRADRQTSYEDLVAIIDACRLADIWNISFATSADEEE
jgi:biopolymer transport protein ExbD